MSAEATANARELSCEECRDLLSDYVDRELDAADRAAVEKHLGACTKCAGESSMMQGLKKVIQQWDGVHGSEALHHRTMDQYIRESRMVPSKPFTDAADAAAGRAAPDSGERKGLSPALVLGGAIVLAVLAFVLIRMLRGG
ncbi:MAG: zf-HC2 domain-containing protein [Planctomycetota bacterium]|nr:zf-HC2 domain-containing protein [Planctomycetota bacterium]